MKSSAQKILRRLSPGPEALLGLAGFLLAATLVGVLLRFRLGVDFTDESWYLAIAQRFALGDKPYVDEIMLMQGASLFTWPFAKLFIAVRGNNDGIVLFFRALYLCFLLSLGTFVFLVS